MLVPLLLQRLLLLLLSPIMVAGTLDQQCSFAGRRVSAATGPVVCACETPWQGARCNELPWPGPELPSPSGCAAAEEKYCASAQKASVAKCSECVAAHLVELAHAGCADKDAQKFCHLSTRNNRRADETALKTSDEAVVQNTGKHNCNWVTGRDFLNAGGVPQNASTKEECCDVCYNTSGCAAGVWCPPTTSGNSCGLTTGRCYTKFATSVPHDTSSSIIACVIPPTPGVLAPPKLGDAVVMNNCSTPDPYGAMRWAPCIGSACFATGAFDVSATRTSIRNSAAGLCLDAAGGFPGWAARIMPCHTTFDSQVFGNNPITSATWRQGPNGTLRTNISRAGSPLNNSGEACLFYSIPGGDPINGDWWTSGQVGMWWCDGAPPASRWRFVKGQLQAAAGPKAGQCLLSTDMPLPTTKPVVPADPVHHSVSCPKGCRGAPCNRYPYCDAMLSAQARAEDFVSRLSLQEKADAIMWLRPQVARLGTPTLSVGEAQHGLLKPCIDKQGVACNSPNTSVCRCATSFPSLVGVGAAFNRSLFEQMGEVMGDEARAYFNVLHGDTNMVFWAPNVNLARNPYWGRNQETPGEDPLVNGLYAEDFISRMQGAPAANWSDAHSPPLKAAATLKHFVAVSNFGTALYFARPFFCGVPTLWR